MTRTTFCFVALDAERTGIIVCNKTITLGMYLIISVCDVTGCHIPPLGDEELALLRATNDNDVVNGLSLWMGRCCKRRRVPKQATPEDGIIDRSLCGITSI